MASYRKVSIQRTQLYSQYFKKNLYYDQHVVALLNSSLFFPSISDSNNQTVWNPVLLCLISFNVVFAVLIIALMFDYLKRWRKRQKGTIPLTFSIC